MTYLIFGGAFDPPHLGHVQMAAAAHKHFPGHKILVLPSPVSPTPGKLEMAPFHHRLAMAHQAFLEPIESGWLEVSSIEEELPSPNYTIATLIALGATPNNRYSLLLGDDQLSSFHLWKDPKKILEIADLIVFHRLKESPSPLLLGNLLGLKSQKMEDDSFEIGGAKITLIHDRVCNASSREIRASLRQGEDTPWLPRDLLAYIKEFQLYGYSLGTPIQ